MTLLTLLVACGGQDTLCDQLCDELVMNCQYSAYPDRASCLQGCAYEASNGADTEKMLSCTTKASCDSFALIECEHRWGPESTTEE